MQTYLQKFFQICLPHVGKDCEAAHLKVLEKCAKNLIGYSKLALNKHESNNDS